LLYFAGATGAIHVAGNAQWKIGPDGKDNWIGRAVYACVSSGSGDLTDEQEKANAQYIYNYLAARGFTKQAICGVLGNMEQESGLNPGAWEVKNNIGHGYGLVQWTDAGTKILDWANLNYDQANEMASNDPKKLMDLNLEYLVIKMQPGGKEWYPTREYNSPYKMTYDEYIQSDKDAGDLAKVFHAHIERSGDDDSGIERRASNARKWYNIL